MHIGDYDSLGDTPKYISGHVCYRYFRMSISYQEVGWEGWTI